MSRHIGPKGLALIKEYEGLRLTPYRCPAGILTVGYGSTGPHVLPNLVLTEADADALLRKDLERFEKGVEEMGGKMTPGQFSALVSFAFNLGLGALSNSTLLSLHKSGHYEGAALQFPRWNKAAGKALPGLTKRRLAEAELYRLPA